MKKILLLLTMFLIGFMLLSSLGISIADYYASNAERAIGHWRKANVTPSDAQWNALKQQVRIARRFDPLNPEYMDLMGQLYSWKQLHLSVGHPDARESRLVALTWYRKVVLRRPLWPYAWMNLATSKMQLGEFDEEFHHAISEAWELGSWEDRIHVSFVKLGFDSRLFLNDREKRMIDESLKRGMKRNWQVLLNLAHEYQLTAKVCQQYAGRDVIDSYCKRLIN